MAFQDGTVCKVSPVRKVSQGSVGRRALKETAALTVVTDGLAATVVLDRPDLQANAVNRGLPVPLVHTGRMVQWIHRGHRNHSPQSLRVWRVATSVSSQP